MRRLVLLAGLLLLLTLPAHARSLTPVEGLEALRKTFAGINDFTADITQEKRLTLMKRSMTMTGTVRFKKPDLFYLELASPYASRMVLRDSVLEQVMGSGERSRIVLPPDQGLTRWFSRIATPVSSVPEGMAVQAEQSGSLYTVTIRPGKGQIRELVIVFEEEGIIRRLVIVEQNSDRAVMTFRKIRRNVGLTDRQFQLD